MEPLIDPLAECHPCYFHMHIVRDFNYGSGILELANYRGNIV
jgi:hypothetical protein